MSPGDYDSSVVLRLLGLVAVGQGVHLGVVNEAVVAVSPWELLSPNTKER